jgi:cytoskeleton protein RodZ
MTQMPSKLDSGPGQVFIDGREALGITQEQAADSLNLSVRAIKAIESDDANSLPDIVYVNGYIRSYAKLLGIASQPLIDAWRAQHAMPADEAAQLNTSPDGSKVDAVNVRPMKMGRWALIALGLSAVFVYFVAFTDDAATPQSPQEIASVSSAGEPSGLGPQADVGEDLDEQTRADGAGAVSVELDSAVAETAANEPSVTDTEVDGVLGDDTASEDDASIGSVAQQAVVEDRTQESTQEKTQEKTDVSPQDLVAETVAEEGNLEVAADEIVAIQAGSQAPDEEVAQIDADVSQAEPEREVAKAFALPRLTEFGDNTIDLTFSEDCWFEIRTIDGELLYADLGRTGQSRRYVGAAPFRIKLGFSPGAALAYNGEPIDLAPYTRQEVARVLLSEQEAEDVQETQEPQASDGGEPINSVGAISLW